MDIRYYSSRSKAERDWILQSPERSGAGFGIEERARPRAVLVCLALLTLSLVVGACGSGGSAEIEAEGVWSRPGVQGNMGAVFMTLKNEGGEADRLLSAQTDVADVVEIHETVLEGDVAKMQRVTGGIEILAGSQVELKPGGYHVMLIGLSRDLAVGDRFAVTLSFEKSDDLTVEAEVR